MSWTKLLQEKSALATALDLLGDKWTLMIISGSLASVHRFNELEQSLGINRNLLSSRLTRLIDAGIIEKRVYQDKPRRYEYRLTELGLELRPVIIGLSAWSEKNITRGKTPISVIHKACGEKVAARIYCLKCEKTVSNQEVTSKLNPEAGTESTRVLEESQGPFFDFS